ncbi:conserved hypothetical protein [Candidatus Magnetomoraceae bacterium gMMP-15]
MKQFRNNILILFLITIFLSCIPFSKSRSVSPYLSTAYSEINKGSAYYKKGCYQNAIEHFFRAYELFTLSDMPESAAMTLNNIGSVYRALGDHEKAVMFFDEAFYIYNNLKKQSGIIQALSNKAAALIDLNLLNEAEKLIEKAQKTDKNFVPLLNNSGILLTRKKEFKQAEIIFKKALSKISSENFYETAMVHSSLGSLFMKTEQIEEALNHFEKALDADRILGFHSGMADDLENMAQASLLLGKTAEAVNYWKRSIKLYSLLGWNKKVNTSMEKWEKIANQAGIDISLIKFFTDLWFKNKSLEMICGD